MQETFDRFHQYCNISNKNFDSLYKLPKAHQKSIKTIIDKDILHMKKIDNKKK